MSQKQPAKGRERADAVKRSLAVQATSANDPKTCYRYLLSPETRARLEARECVRR